MGPRTCDGGGGRDLVFVSYSRADAAWVQRFRVLLKPLMRRKRLSLWVDTAIRTGDEWHPEIEQAMLRSGVALLLVSADFLASDFVMDQELPALLRCRVRLAPVLVGECYWQEIPELARVQWLHDPGRDGALNLVEADQPGLRDRRIRQVCDRLLAIAPAAQRADDPQPRGGPAQGSEAVVVPMSSMRGILSEVPTLPPGYVVRDELDELISAVVGVESRGAIGLIADAAGVGLHGMGGIGKSVLAAAAARDDRIRSRFTDGVYWVTVGERPDLLSLQLELLKRLTDDVRTPRTVSDATEELIAVLAERRVLLVVDDVWSDAAAFALRVTGAQGRVLYTSRDRQVLIAGGAEPRRLGVLSLQASRVLAAGILRCPASALPAAADRALAEVGNIPLAVALLAAAVRGGRSWDEVRADLDRDVDVYGDHPYANTFRAMQIGVARLASDLRTALLGLAVFPTDTSIPIAAVARYWAHIRHIAPEQTAANLDHLAAANLLRRDGDAIAFHDLQHDYLVLHSPQLAVLHADLLEAYRSLLPQNGREQWWQLPLDEPYIWDHLIVHLVGAGERSTLAATVADPAYQARRIAQGASYACEADLALAARHLPDNPLVAWWQGWLVRHTHLLSNRPTGGDSTGVRLAQRIACTLLAWISADPQRPAGIRQERLIPLLSQPYLAVRSGLNISAQALKRVIVGHTGAVTAVAFSPDGSRLATASSDRTVRVWDPDTGQVIATLTGHDKMVMALAFSPDGNRLATGSDDGITRLWEHSNGRTTFTLTGHTDGVTGVAFSPDGTRLATASDDGTARLWDPISGDLLAILDEHTDAVTGVAFSPDGTLATTSYDGTVRLWDPATGQTVVTVSGSNFWAVAFSADGTRMATTSLNGTVRLWEPTTGRAIATLTGHAGAAKAVTFSPDGTRLASTGNDGTVRLWECSRGKIVATLAGHTDWVTAVAYSPDGGRLATASYDQTVRLWDPNREGIAGAPIGHTNVVTGVAFSPDGTRLGTSSYDRTVRLWDPATGQVTTTLTGHENWVTAVAFSPDGTRLASTSYDKTARVWDTTTGRTTATLTGHTEPVIAAAYSPDGTRLATTSRDRTLRLWDPVTGEAIATFAGHNDEVAAVAFSPDGTRLATASRDRTVRLWNPATGETVATLTGHTNPVAAVAFSPDGTRLATAGNDKTVRLWDPDTVKPIDVLVGHSGLVTAVVFSPDGTCLASADDDGAIIVWDEEGREQASVVIQPARSLAWSSTMIAADQWGNPALIEVKSGPDGIVGIPAADSEG